MLKQVVLSTLMVLALGVPARASLDVDGTPWTLEFDGSGHPADQGWSTWGYNSSTYNDNYKIGTGVLVGWQTSNGNPGGSIGKLGVGNGLTKAGGWTVEWRVVTYNNLTTLNVIYIDDDVSSGVRIDYAPNQVTLRDGWTGGASQAVGLDMGSFAERTFRVVRQAGSDTAELYIDNSFVVPAASIALIGPTGDNNNRVYWGNSVWESSWDFFRCHSGATTTVPAPGTLALLGLGGLHLLRRRVRV